MEKSKKKTMTAKRKWLIALCVILAIILICAIAVCILADSILGGIGRFDGTDSTYSPEQLESMLGDETAETDPISEKAESILSSKNIINILLVGQDRREGDGKRTRSDAMILCTINTSKKTLTMTSFMRDMWVYIPGYYNNRINVPYMRGGFDLLNDTLEYNFGVRADYNVEIDFSGFMKAIDAVGGVDIELTSAEARYLNKYGNWDIEKNYHWTLKEGVNHLTGSQALAYSRIREIGNDFGRTNRQRTVLNALIEKAKTLNLTEIYSLVREITPLLTTDMTNTQIMDLVIDILPMLSELEIVSQRIPMDDEYSFGNKNGASVIILSKSNFEANKKLLVETLSDD